MRRAVAAVSLAALMFLAAFGQSAQSAFEVADVHATPRITTLVMRSVFRGGRYELRNANMVDLIRTAYGIDAENVVDGPTWLEFDRFDVIAKAPPNTSSETLNLMLRTLLADRFKLVVHNDTKPVAGFVLALGKGKHKLKEAEPSDKSGCQPQTSSSPITGAAGQISLPLTNLSCHNITMEAFASALRGLSTGYVTNAVVDSTGLKGNWDFDLKFTQKGLVPLVGSERTVRRQ